jgi:hypothetical protein
MVAGNFVIFCMHIVIYDKQCFQFINKLEPIPSDRVSGESQTIKFIYMFKLESTLKRTNE